MGIREVLSQKPAYSTSALMVFIPRDLAWPAAHFH